MATITPNMNLIVPTIGADSGLVWEQSVDSDLAIIDQHDHSPGRGVQLNATSLNFTSDLPLNNNNLTTVRSLRFTPQGSPLSGALDLGCLYESGVDLWYNDGNGNQVKITSGGLVNATSSGISSGTASASFVSGVLTVLASTATPANIQGGSLLLGNNVANTKYLTLSPPSAMAANYNLVLPSLPSQKNLVSLDTSGNIKADVNVDGTTIAFNGTTLSLAPVNYATSSTVSGTFTATTIVSVTVTCLGRPIVLVLQSAPDVLGSLAPQSTPTVLQFFRGTTHLGMFDFNYSAVSTINPNLQAHGVGNAVTQEASPNVSVATTVANTYPPSIITYVDVAPPAGTNTYLLNIPTGTIIVGNIVLVAYEI